MFYLLLESRLLLIVTEQRAIGLWLSEYFFISLIELHVPPLEQAANSIGSTCKLHSQPITGLIADWIYKNMSCL